MNIKFPDEVNGGILFLGWYQWLPLKMFRALNSPIYILCQKKSHLCTTCKWTETCGIHWLENLHYWPDPAQTQSRGTICQFQPEREFMSKSQNSVPLKMMYSGPTEGTTSWFEWLNSLQVIAASYDLLMIQLAWGLSVSSWILSWRYETALSNILCQTWRTGDGGGSPHRNSGMGTTFPTKTTCSNIKYQKIREVPV